MNEPNKQTNFEKSVPWIALGVALTTLAIIFFYIFDIFNTPLTKCYTKVNHNDVIGIIVSSVALVISLYFIVLGLHARQIKREYDFEIKTLHKDFLKAHNQMTIHTTNISNGIFDHYSSLIGALKTYYNNLPKSPQKKTNNQYYEKLKLAQAQFACNADYIDEDKKIIGINTLGDLSKNIDDINLLEKAISNPKSSEGVRNAAGKAYLKIKKRLESTTHRPNP